ncbi:dGTP triphosphohydrolase [Halococcus agarilyticus]|uniref:dGTP triphosphohydrolase n=1 Tax=Halococcus agarilyticus TaxID=1232219 RepID=UPI0009ACB06F|nr:dNTP triphosphohydrolase [Halococcus agarilyticus]
MNSERRYGTRILGVGDNDDSENEDPVVEIEKPNTTSDKPQSEDQSGRSPFQRDLDRIKYTKEFRRLKDVTQVARAGESYLYHDRLSHSLKVAQVGRRFAEYVIQQEEGTHTISRELDPDMIEAACMAHDLGHPPFGHLAESTLDKLLQEKTNPYRKENDLDPTLGELPENLDATDADNIDAYLQVNSDELAGIRFEGNAQSLRILTRLATHRDAYTGLALTVGVLLGVGKYPYGRGEWFNPDAHKSLDPWPDEPKSVEGFSKGKFGFYEDDENINKAVRYAAVEGDESISGRAAAAGIMDYADDLTYAIHDLTDFYMDGRLPLDRLLREAFAELDEKDQEGLEEADYEQAPRRELEELHRELEYDEEITTPTEVITSLATSAIITGENVSLLNPFDGTPQQRNELEAFTSFLIEYYLNRIYYDDESDHELVDTDDAYISLRFGEQECELYLSDRLEEQLSILQQITKYYVIRQPSLIAQQRGQQRVVRETFEALYDEASKDDLSWSAVPTPYRNWLETEHSHVGNLGNDAEKRARVVADFITSMTEPQVVALHKRLTGDNPGSLQNEIIR